MQIDNQFLNQINEIYGEISAKRIKKAFDFVNIKHQGKVRENGEESVSHPFAVAKILIENKADEDTVICGLLHDCLDDTETSENEIENNFGTDILKILQGIIKLNHIKKAYYKNNDESDNLRKMLLSMGSDTRIAFVKLADRLHNMQTLYIKSKEKQLKIAKETIDIYSPIAERLGMNLFKRQLDDLCFKYLYASDYIAVNQFLDEYYKKSENIISDITAKIVDIANKHDIEARIQSRKKSGFSVFNKWQTKGKDKVFDIIAFRIIVKDVKDCYTMLGSVNSEWKPMEGRIKDYIANPKKNLYMSLHTTLFYTIENKQIPFEVQIRTEEMHSFCEYGIAAHWIYKEKGVRAIKSKSNIYALKNSLTKSSESLNQETDKLDIETKFYADKIYVFTPNLNVVELPKGALPIDFAYVIHTNLGNRCIGAKVNGKMVQLTTELKTGDNVEIITSSASKGPSRDWLKIVKSREALSKIKSFFKKEKREENIKIGKDILDEYAKRNGFTLSKLFEDKDTLTEIKDKYRLETVEDFYAIVGYGGLTSSQVLGKFIAKMKQNAKKEKQINLNSESKSDEAVIIGGHSDLYKKFAKCCNPIPGDEIVGYVSRGKGVTIHRKDCPCVECLEQDRLIKTIWNDDGLGGKYNATFKILAKNTLSIFNAISNKIAENKIEIAFMTSTESSNGEDAVLNVGVKIKSRKELAEIMNKISSMPDIYSVKQLGEKI